MAKNPPSFQFYPQDFVAGTMHLDNEAIGTYLLLLCFQWTHRFLPKEPSKLARICRLNTDDFVRIWPQIQDKFVQDTESTIANPRLQSIMQKALELSEVRAKSGRKGGLSKCQANAKQMGKQTGKQKCSKGRLKTEDRRLKIKDRELDVQFEQFWAVVNRKVGKARARKHYAEAVAEINKRESDPHEYLRRQMAAYAKSDRGSGEYAWEPCSWLRDGHYDDDQADWARERNGSEQSASDRTLEILKRRREREQQ